MTYNKPQNLTYTDLAIYFDEHINDTERNDNLLYEYVYHLVYMLACKAQYFHKFEDYDQFALYAASRIYIRTINKKDANNNTEIKSILNYIKAVLYPLKVEYQKEEFGEVLNPEAGGFSSGNRLLTTMQAAVQSDYNLGLVDEILNQIKQLPTYIQEILANSPYRKDKIICRRLYISILLSFLRSITFNNLNLARIQRKEKKGPLDDDNFFKMLERERETSACVWRLEDSMLNYVHLLTNQVRSKFGEDIIEIKQSFVLSDEAMNAILMSSHEAGLNTFEEE